MQALMQRAAKAQPKGPKFTKPDIEQFIPEQARDAVARVIAAGMKVIYAPGMRDQVRQDIERDVPVPQKLAEATLGLMLTLDQQSKGGIPMEALFPAAMELLGEAAEILSAAGQTVTQEDYNEAARILFVQMGRKLGMNDDQIMQAAGQAVGEEPGAPAQPDPEAEAQAAWDEGEGAR